MEFCCIKGIPTSNKLIPVLVCLAKNVPNNPVNFFLSLVISRKLGFCILTSKDL